MRRMLPAMSKRYFHNNLFARFLCYCDFIWLEDFVFDKTSSSYCCRFFFEQNSRNIHEVADFANAIIQGRIHAVCINGERG